MAGRLAGKGGRGGGRLLLPALAFLLTACATETISLLQPPTLSDLSGSFQLGHAASSNSGVDFLGYQVLYRLYGDLADAEEARTKLSALSASTQSPDTVFGTLRGQALGFRTMQFARSGSDLTDVLPLEADEQDTSVTFSFETSGWTVSKQGLHEFPATAERSFSSASSPALFALPGLSLADDMEDYTPGGNPGSSAYIVLCAVAIGRDPNLILTFVHSLPAVFPSDSATPMVVGQ